MMDVPLLANLKTVLVAQHHRLPHVHPSVEMESLLAVKSAMTATKLIVYYFIVHIYFKDDGCSSTC